jgi:hypothetical protein
LHIVVALGFAAFAANLPAAPIIETLTLDTSGLATNSNYIFDFLLSGTAGNTVTIADPNFGASGNLGPNQPSTLMLTSSLSTFGDEATWLFHPGATASFSLNSTDIAPRPGFIPDVLHILLEDSSGNVLPTADSNYNSLYALSLTGGADMPTLFTGTAPPLGDIGFGLSGSTGSSEGTSTPEPTSAAMLVVGGAVAALLGSLCRKQRTAT